MIEPLTKVSKAGKLYKRRSVVLASIEAAIGIDRPTLERRAAISTPESPEYLSSECLLYFIRKRHREANAPERDKLLDILLRRNMQNLKGTIPDGRAANALYLRDEVLGRFGELVAEDGTGDLSNELDYYEVNFNGAFAALRIDVLRAEGRARQKLDPLPEDDGSQGPLGDSDEDLGTLIGGRLRTPATQTGDALRMRLLRAIYALPENERKAVTLVHILGYDEESDDPTKVTAATLCEVTGRTIRNWLRGAAKKLKQFKEEL